jgi:hypothetical protein
VETAARTSVRASHSNTAQPGYTARLPIIVLGPTADVSCAAANEMGSDRGRDARQTSCAASQIVRYGKSVPWSAMDSHLPPSWMYVTDVSARWWNPIEGMS